jgi:hypothetical protein
MNSESQDKLLQGGIRLICKKFYKKSASEFVTLYIASGGPLIPTRFPDQL